MTEFANTFDAEINYKKLETHFKTPLPNAIYFIDIEIEAAISNLLKRDIKALDAHENTTWLSLLRTTYINVLNDIVKHNPTIKLITIHSSSELYQHYPFNDN